MVKAKQEETTKEISKSAHEILQYNLLGEETNKLTVSKKIFGVKINKQVIAQYIRVFQTNQRQGNASTKTRAEVAGTTKKMYKQKGTGKARHGSYKAPIFKGGGIVGGPKPKNYELTMNKKQRTIALFSALTTKYSQNDILGLLLDKKNFKTKDVFSFITKLKFNDKKVLFVLPSADVKSFVLADRNITKVENIYFHSLNAFEVLFADKLIFIGDSVTELEKHFKLE